LCLRSGRNPLIVKSYVAVFVCMAVRAIHLEWVSDLSTEAFIAALTRFISRRRLPANIYSDGGFIGTDNELKKLKLFIDSETHQNSISDFMANKGVKFNFNPPRAPHHGGLWEAGVKAMKYHLKRVIQDRKLSIEEFLTLLAQVEASLNSRPLTQLSSDPNNYNVLTPGHSLVGDSFSSIPQQDITHLNPNRLSRWQAVQQIYQHFWRRWSSEYLVTLQSRPKWFNNQPNIEPGVLVLLRDDDPEWGPLKWKLGRVVKVYPGKDGKVRVCKVKVPNGREYKRPVVKLSPLPIYE